MSYAPNTHNPVYLYQTQAPNGIGGILFSLDTNHLGEISLSWFIPPTELVELACEQPQTLIAIDAQGNQWNGNQVLHFIKTVPPHQRFYNRIGEQV